MQMPFTGVCEKSTILGRYEVSGIKMQLLDLTFVIITRIDRTAIYSER